MPIQFPLHRRTNPSLCKWLVHYYSYQLDPVRIYNFMSNFCHCFKMQLTIIYSQQESFYISNTKHLKLKFNGSFGLQFCVFVDSSYASHRAIECMRELHSTSFFTPSAHWRIRLDHTSFSVLAQISSLGYAIFTKLSPTIQIEISQSTLNSY